MATMMNGYHFEKAKDGANQYSVELNSSPVISGSNYPSAKDVYNYIADSIENAGTSDIVKIIKTYDSKTKRNVNEVKVLNIKKSKKEIA